VADPIILSTYIYVYLFIMLVSLYFLFTYKKEFKADDLIESFIYLTHKVILLHIFITFGFAFIFIMIDSLNSKIPIFLQENITGLIYYSMFSFSLYYGLRLINWFKSFYKENDLFGISYFKTSKGGKK